MDRRRFAELAAALDASPAEAAGLVVLLVGAVLAAVLVWWGSVPRSGAPEPPAPLPTAAAMPVTVHVAGAVQQPGLVRLAAGARVADALAAAGGPRPDAALDELNLARALTDGERILVPAMGETPGSVGEGGQAWSGDGRLDLNLATAADLEQLPGIGPVIASRILDWREEHGRFDDVGQLREISGIGERTFAALSELVVVR